MGKSNCAVGNKPLVFEAFNAGGVNLTVNAEIFALRGTRLRAREVGELADLWTDANQTNFSSRRSGSEISEDNMANKNWNGKMETKIRFKIDR